MSLFRSPVAKVTSSWLIGDSIGDPGSIGHVAVSQSHPAFLGSF